MAGAKVRRGDLVTVALPVAYGKPRPALVIQSDFFDEHPSVTILPLTRELRRTPLFRVTVKPPFENGLLKPSQVMADKARTIPRDKIGEASAAWTRTQCWPSTAPWPCSSASPDGSGEGSPGRI
jgi:mRNA interferase MazF